MPNKKDKLIIVGAGETAEIAYEYFSQDSPFEVVAFSVEKDFLTKDSLNGIPIIPFEELETIYNPGEYQAFVAVSFVQLNRVRTRLYQATKKKGFKIANYISSDAFVWRNVEIGENCFIFESNVIQHRVKIGNNVTLWSGNHIGHSTTIGDNCFISSHVVISGNCEIGKSCFFGVNSSLADNLIIGQDTLVGAGAVVINNTGEGKVYMGNPARVRGRGSLATLKVRDYEE